MNERTLCSDKVLEILSLSQRNVAEESSISIEN